MYISMSYHCSKYEFLGPESDLEYQNCAPRSRWRRIIAIMFCS
jgi:hypothetical protein